MLLYWFSGFVVKPRKGSLTNYPSFYRFTVCSERLLQGSNRTGFTGFPGLTGFFYPQIMQIRNEIICENPRNPRMKRCDWVICLLRGRQAMPLSQRSRGHC
ncbi:MAG: hypothetical protein [Olavius algarvensis Gamma 1 endosymbiont]|nr:MAG: hypothetical protein [Olavius algarvensis Gamma 1 endosymbiont]